MVLGALKVNVLVNRALKWSVFTPDGGDPDEHRSMLVTVVETLGGVAGNGVGGRSLKLARFQNCALQVPGPKSRFNRRGW